MDEPRSNLDAQLRARRREELTDLHQRPGATFRYVTHDQFEAMTMADALALVADGGIEQVGTPQVLYDRPATATVARFWGNPAMNLLPVEVGPPGSPLLGGYELLFGSRTSRHRPSCWVFDPKAGGWSLGASPSGLFGPKPLAPTGSPPSRWAARWLRSPFGREPRFPSMRPRSSGDLGVRGRPGPSVWCPREADRPFGLSKRRGVTALGLRDRRESRLALAFVVPAVVLLLALYVGPLLVLGSFVVTDY